MLKAEPQQQQSQSVARQGKGVAPGGPQGERIAQLEAAMDSSPRQVAQKKLFDSIHNSPRQTAQRKKFDSLFGPVQREEAEEPLQPKVAQRQEAPAKPNQTGLPDNLKSGIENLSGMSMDSVRVHYNSSQPAQLN
ncbi:MAG: DUF4157 domain-containing protein, partial [Burkholderiales bacterium]